MIDAKIDQVKNIFCLFYEAKQVMPARKTMEYHKFKILNKTTLKFSNIQLLTIS